MSEIYWIIVLGKIAETCNAVLLISILFVAVVTIVYLANNDSDYYEERETKLRAANLLKVFIAAFVVSLIGRTFTPTTNELFAIYGIGGTIDYLQENKTAKQIPDKCLQAVDKFLDNYNDKEN